MMNTSNRENENEATTTWGGKPFTLIKGDGFLRDGGDLKPGTTVRLAPFEGDGARMEVLIHRPNRGFLRNEVSIVLSGVTSSSSLHVAAADGRGGTREGPSSLDAVRVVTTIQESRAETIRLTPESECEKDRLLEAFCRFADELRLCLREKGYWSDSFDPCSGLLRNSPGNVIWPEVQCLSRIAGFRTSMAGACHIVIHPTWGHRIYPATLLTDAPAQVVRDTIEAMRDIYYE